MRSLLNVAFILMASAPLAAARSDIDGAWVLSGRWTGYMGIALKIKGDHYKYWFYSDVGPSTITMTINGRTTTHTQKVPNYPLRGRVVVNADAIELRGPGKYYDRKWHLITYRGVPCLLADLHYREWKRGEEFADDRLLFRLPTFTEKRPRMNYGGDEKPDGSVTRTSPLLSK